jgi:hypothetical protein
MTEWEPLDLSILRECSEALRPDEILYTDSFNVLAAMNAADFGTPRLDAHLAALHHNSLEESLSSSPPLPDSSATPEEILQICSKFLDLQAARLQGHLPATTILTSLYLQPRYSISHPILRFLFRVFSSTSAAIEIFASRVCSSHCRSMYWQVTDSTEKDLSRVEDSILRSELSEFSLSPELYHLVEFEISFSEFLSDPINAPLPPNLEFPFEPTEIGVDPLFRYRDIPPSDPPPLSHIPSHETAMLIFKQLFEDIVNVRSFIHEDIKLVELIHEICVWNESREIVNFARLVALVFVLGFIGEDPLILGKVTPLELLTRELTAIFMPRKFLNARPFRDIVENVFPPVFAQVIGCILSPIPIAHGSLPSHGVALWGTLQSQGYETFHQIIPSGELPRCKSKDHQLAAAMMYPIWGLMISVELLLAEYRWGEICELYTVRDLSVMLYCLHHVTRTAAIAYERARLGKSVFLVKNNSKKTAVWTRTEKEVLLIFEKEVKSNTEKLMGALCAVLRGNFNIVRILRNWGTLEGLTALSFSEEGLFVERAKVVNTTPHFEMLSYHEFVQEIGMEGERERVVMQEAEKLFQKGKTELIAWVGTTGKKTDPLFRDALGSALAGSQFLKQMSRGKQVCLKNPGKVLFPIFTFSATRNDRFPYRFLIISLIRFSRDFRQALFLPGTGARQY